MPVKALKEFLDRNKVKYVIVSHSPTFTAQEIAASAHITGKALAKTVIVKISDRMAMAVLPADKSIDFDLLTKLAGGNSVALATEAEFQARFPDCEVGAMPPFGNLYDMEVFVERGLVDNGEIVFNAGSHRELVRLACRDFERLVKPRIGPFATAMR